MYNSHKEQVGEDTYSPFQWYDKYTDKVMATDGFYIEFKMSSYDYPLFSWLIGIIFVLITLHIIR